MSSAAWRVTRVETKAREILGEKAEIWMKMPNRTLGDLTPRQLAETSEAGAHIVLTELTRNAIVFRHWATQDGH